VAVVRAGNRGGSAVRHHDAAPAGEEFEDLEPAPASTKERAEAETPAPAEQPVGPAPAAKSVAERPGDLPPETTPEGRRLRRRRQKPVDDFGFSDLRDPDEKGTGTSGRPSR
jgi:hypothetical protein